MEDHYCSGDSCRRDLYAGRPRKADLRAFDPSAMPGPGMIEQEWIEIGGQLVRSYQLLKEAVARHTKKPRTMPGLLIC
jgi:hypothetical protein